MRGKNTGWKIAGVSPQEGSRKAYFQGCRGKVASAGKISETGMLGCAKVLAVDKL